MIKNDEERTRVSLFTHQKHKDAVVKGKFQGFLRHGDRFEVIFSLRALYVRDKMFYDENCSSSFLYSYLRQAMTAH